MGARGSGIGSRARLWCGIVVGEERIARVVLTGEAVFVDEPTVSLSDSRNHHYHHHLEGSRCVSVSLSLFEEVQVVGTYREAIVGLGSGEVKFGFHTRAIESLRKVSKVPYYLR